MKRSPQSIQVRITGKTGEVDGYMEYILGTLSLGGTLISHKLSKRVRPNGITQLYIDATVSPAPIGNMGTDDIPERTDDD